MVTCAVLGLIFGGSVLAAQSGLIQLSARVPRIATTGLLWYCAIRMAVIVFKPPNFYMVVSDDGVSLHDAMKRREHIARSDLVRAKVDQKRKEIVFELKTWRPITWPVEDVFGSN